MELHPSAHRILTRSDVAPSLALDGIAKRFGSTTALEGAELSVMPGTVHALLGENGAGKTTLMRIAFGMTQPDKGTVRIDGVAARLTSSADAIARGVWMVHQHFTQVPAMTVAENVALGLPGFRHDAERARARVHDVGTRTGLRLDPDARIETLPVGAQQRLEIVKAFARDARIIILDEPTAVLAPAEALDLIRVLRAFADGGGSVVLITHKIREALSSADRFTVLRAGRTVLVARRGDVDEGALARAMVGDVLAPPTGDPAAVGNVVLRARDLHIRDERGVPRVNGVTMEARSGEILGVAGVEGAGHRELLRALAGRLAFEGDVIRPIDVGYIPEDRQREALILDFDLAENVALRGAGQRRGRVPWRAVRERAAGLARHFDVRAAGVTIPAATLSGGNQQKLVLARELANAPAALVIESPTRGLDVAASMAVHTRIREAARRGAAIVLYSPDLDEVLALADRVIVMFEGRLRETARDREVIGSAMLGL